MSILGDMKLSSNCLMVLVFMAIFLIPVIVNVPLMADFPEGLTGSFIINVEGCPPPYIC
jgi:hypothetical protein